MLLHNLVTPSITEIPHLRYMRPFVYFSLFYAATLVAADHTEHIDSQDERISYSKDWKFVSPYIICMEGKLASSMVYSDKSVWSYIVLQRQGFWYSESEGVQ